jgi:hypothetical protein
MLQTRHEWIAKLAAASSAIASMHVGEGLEDARLENDAVNLANCDAHCRLVVRAIENLVLSGASTQDSARNLLRNLIGPNTYGFFAELAAYDWLMRCNVRIETQVDMSADDVLAANGSTLDGKIVHDGTHFDVKAFGFNGHRVERLKEKLEASFPSEQVLIEESWDLSMETFFDLLKSAPDVANKLKKDRIFREGRMRIRLAPKAPVTVTMRGGEPYHLAKENALYPFKYAKQFTRNAPFILIFVVHPWFNAQAIHRDFAGVDTTFTRSLARRAFMQFSNDPSSLQAVCRGVAAKVTMADASRLLSAIFFVNVWPLDADPSIDYLMPSWLYINPRATHCLTRGRLELFRANNPHGTSVDDFADDDY